MKRRQYPGIHRNSHKASYLGDGRASWCFHDRIDLFRVQRNAIFIQQVPEKINPWLRKVTLQCHDTENLIQNYLIFLQMGELFLYRG